MITKSLIAILGVVMSPLLYSQGLNMPRSAADLGTSGRAAVPETSCSSCRKLSAVDPGTSVKTSSVDFGMIGLTASQTLRLSIIAFPPSPIFPPTPVCVAEIGFASMGGGSVGPTKTVNLGPGQGDFLDLNGSTLALPSGGRAEVQATTLTRSTCPHATP